MQARLALQHGRPVFLMRSLLEHDWARGYAQCPGVTVVETADGRPAAARIGAEGPHLGLIGYAISLRDR